MQRLQRLAERAHRRLPALGQPPRLLLGAAQPLGALGRLAAQPVALALDFFTTDAGGRLRQRGRLLVLGQGGLRALQRLGHAQQLLDLLLELRMLRRGRLAPLLELGSRLLERRHPLVRRSRLRCALLERGDPAQLALQPLPLRRQLLLERGAPELGDGELLQPLRDLGLGGVELGLEIADLGARAVALRLEVAQPPLELLDPGRLGREPVALGARLLELLARSREVVPQQLRLAAELRRLRLARADPLLRGIPLGAGAVALGVRLSCAASKAGTS